MAKRRVLRLKTTMMFSGQLVMVPGDYEGDAIPPELEEEFESGSPHVEEVVTVLSAGAEPAKAPRKKKSGPGVTAAGSGTAELGAGTPGDKKDEVIPPDVDTKSLTGVDDDDQEAAAAEAEMASKIDPAKDNF